MMKNNDIKRNVYNIKLKKTIKNNKRQNAKLPTRKNL